MKPSKSGHPVEPDLAETLHAIGFTQKEITGMPEGVTMFVAQQPGELPKVQSGPWEGFEVVSSYSRTQAIEDGQLIDLMAGNETRKMVAESGLRVPVAMTATAFHDTVLAGTTEPEGGDGEFSFPSGQSMKGRLWDVLQMLRFAIRKNRETDRVYFKVAVDVKGDGKHETVSLWALIGPGDTAAPVLTIMLEGED
jgi:hypothetical protein